MGNCVVVAPRRDVVGIGDDAGHQQDDAVVVTDRGNRSQHVAPERHLSPRALHVDDRALARDDDRFLERAEPHLGVDHGGERARQLDAFPLEHAEPCQRERDGVRAWPQVLDAVLPRSVGHRRANLFDECGARGFHRDSGKNRPGGVTHRPRDDRLCRRRRGKEDEPREYRC